MTMTSKYNFSKIDILSIFSYLCKREISSFTSIWLLALLFVLIDYWNAYFKIVQRKPIIIREKNILEKLIS